MTEDVRGRWLHAAWEPQETPANPDALVVGHNVVHAHAAPAPGRKDDDTKARLDLLPFAALDSIGRVLAYGAKRYGDENWRLVEGAPRRYFAAALRHLTAWGCGEELDPDSGESHLAHAACSLMFLLALKAKPPTVAAQPPAPWIPEGYVQVPYHAAWGRMNHGLPVFRVGRNRSLDRVIWQEGRFHRATIVDGVQDDFESPGMIQNNAWLHSQVWVVSEPKQPTAPAKGHANGE